MKQILIAVLKRITADLKVSNTQIRNAVDSKAIGTYTIDPLEFLKLTTPSDTYIEDIKKKAKSVDFYNEADSIIHPFLTYNSNDGKVTGHEGRHRAAAILNENGKSISIALLPRHPTYGGRRDWKPEDLPTTLKSEFRSYTYDLDPDLIEYFDENMA